MDMTNFGVVQRALPSPTNDTVEKELRLTAYGDQYNYPIGSGRHNAADEGSYFIASNPVIGTGIAPNAVETSFSDTRGFFVFNNTTTANSSTRKKIFLDYIKLLMSGTAPTATTVLHFLLKRSTVSREPTTAANKTLLTPVNTSRGGPLSICRCMSYANAGAMTVPASTADDPQVARVSLPTSLGITGDEYLIRFGGEDNSPQPGLTAVRATAAARITAVAPPVIIEPGDWLVVHRWWLTEATNAPTFEFEIGWWER